MHLFRHLTRSSRDASPSILRTAVLIEAVILIGPTVQRSPSALAPVLVAIELVLLIGLWNMKRWAAAGLASTVVLAAWMTSPGTLFGDSVGALVLGTALRLSPLVPVLFLWPRMTWKPAAEARPREVAKVAAVLIMGLVGAWVVLGGLFFLVEVVVNPPGLTGSAARVEEELQARRRPVRATSTTPSTADAGAQR